MKRKMTEELRIRMIQLAYSVDKQLTVAEIAAELGVSSATVSRWRWFEAYDIYTSLLKYRAEKPDGLSEDDLVKKYGISRFQLKRIITDVIDNNKECQEDNLV